MSGCAAWSPVVVIVGAVLIGGGSGVLMALALRRWR